MKTTQIIIVQLGNVVTQKFEVDFDKLNHDNFHSLADTLEALQANYYFELIEIVGGQTDNELTMMIGKLASESMNRLTEITRQMNLHLKNIAEA